MSFPTDPLDVLVEVALGADITADPTGWSFTDVTDLIYTRNIMTIGRGRGDQAATADTSTLAMTGDNRDGHWSTRNPNGDWYGQLRIGTPVRVSAESHVRYAGFFSSLPPRWDVSGFDRYAPLAAKGLLYRLSQARSAARSALRRTILGAAATAPAQYWALEDGTDATSAASGLPDGSPMQVIGEPLFGAENTAAGTAAGVDFGLGGRLIANLTQVSSSDLTVSVIARWDGAATTTLMAVHGPVEFTVYLTAGQIFVDLIAVGGTVTLTGTQVGDSVAHHVAVTLHDNGVVVQAALRVDGVSVASSNVFAAMLLSPTGVELNPRNQTDTFGPSVSHLALYHSIVTADLSAAAAGYLAEEAHTRFLRLCAEDGVPATSAASESNAMGVQGVKTLIELLRETEASDQGYLYEGLDFGLVFQAHTEREDLTPTLELDYTTAGHVAPPLEPTDDDQGARNDVEVKREGGSSARQTEEDANVELSIPNIGRRDESITLSLGDDSQPAQVAGWRLHMGTFPGYRYPTLSLNLAAGPSLIANVCSADLAFRTTVDNPPDDIGPDAVSVIVEGYTETLEPYGWDIAANCSLAEPWRVGILANTSGDTDPDLGWLDWDSCVLAEVLDTTETGVDVTTTPLIGTASDDRPFDIYVGGERMTVTNVTGSSNPQTLTVTRSVNGIVKTHSISDVVTLAAPLILTM